MCLRVCVVSLVIYFNMKKNEGTRLQCSVSVYFLLDLRNSMKPFRGVSLCRFLFVRHKSSSQRTDMTTPLWTFHRESQRWMEKQFTSGDERISRQALRLLSYNIWFSNKYQARRFQGLCQILDESHTDVIGLQEGQFFPFRRSLLI